jgi:hypothetical protein
MSTWKQFLGLLRYQLAVNPFVFLFPLFFGIPYGMEYVMGWRHDRDLSVASLNLPMMIGVLWLVPTFLSTEAEGRIFQAMSGAEFILTRAVDRHLLYRARACLFYVMIPIFPLAMFFIPQRSHLQDFWQLWIYVAAAILIPILIFIVHPIKHSLTKLVALAILMALLGHLASVDAIFACFVTHQSVFWILTIPALILAQLWCERRFAQLEQ